MAALAWILCGCARAALVLPVETGPHRPPVPAHSAVRGYESAVDVIAGLLVTELGLPLPRRFTVFVYPTRVAFEHGLVREGRLSPAHAVTIARTSLGLGQQQRFFVNDEALRGAPPRAWLGLVAHEMTHLAQYELAGGRRGRSEQWLREGLAEWVAAWTLERLGAEPARERRQRALVSVYGGPRTGPPSPPGARGAPAQPWRPSESRPIDLVALGHPRDWHAHLLAAGSAPTYGVAFLLTDELVRRRGIHGVAGYFRAFAGSDDRFGHFRRAFGESIRDFERTALDRIRREARTVPRAAMCDSLSAPGAEVPLVDLLEECDRDAD